MVSGYCLLVNVFLQDIQMLFFVCFWYVVDYIGCWGVWVSGEDKVVVYIEIDVGDKFYGFFEIFCGFVWEVDDKVGVYLNIWVCFMQFVNNCFIFQCGMGVFYQVQYMVGVILYWQVQEVYQFWCIVINVDDIVGKFDWVVGGEVNVVDVVDGGDQVQQVGKVVGGVVVIFIVSGVNVLFQQIDFMYILCCQLGDFKQDIVVWMVNFFFVGIWYYVVGVVFIVIFYN